MLDVGAGTGCLIPSLLRVAGSEQQRQQRKRRKEAGGGELDSSSSSSLSSSALLPMDYLAVDVSAGMLDALERIHGSSSTGGQKGQEETEEQKEEKSLLGNLPRIRTWLGDVESVPQFQAPFDACLFNAVFGNVHDQRSSLLAAALLLRPGKGRVVVGHPMGRRWHERLRAADAVIVPHALPRDEARWAELLRGLPLELVDAVNAEGEGRGGGEEREGAAAVTAAAMAAAGEGGGNGENASTSSPPRLIVDDEDCYIAVLRVPPAWRLPASLYGTLSPPPPAAASSASVGEGGGGGKGARSSSSSSSSSSSLLPQLLPRLPWQQQQGGEDKGGSSEETSFDNDPPPLPPLLLGGTVVKGFGRGSSRMGVPTANIDPGPLEEVLSGVPDGVYFGWARLLPPPESGETAARGGDGRRSEEAAGEEEEEEEDLDGSVHKCVLNIGRRPTFDGEEKGVGVLSVEVHVLHEFGKSEKKGGEGTEEEEEEGQVVNFCGRELRAVATGFVRPEMRFPGIQALVSRIRSDVATASVALEEEKEHGWAKGHEYLWKGGE